MARQNSWLVVLGLLAATVVGSVARCEAAETDTSIWPWSTPSVVVTQLANAAHPALAYSASGTAHAVWETSGAVMYSSRSPGQGWSAPVRLAAGMTPGLVTDSAGGLHVVFANQFMGNYEIYYVRRQTGTWSLPVNVSRTSGASGHPAIAVGDDGSLHIAWTDNTPGYNTIYCGKWDGRFWITQPVQNARGQAPALAVAQDRSLYLAWQEQIYPGADPPTPYEIFLSQYIGGRWSLPVNISDSPDSQSLGVGVTASSESVAHLVWIEQGRKVNYAYGRGTTWSPVRPVWQATASASAPAILAERSNLLYIAWDEGAAVRVTSAPPGTSDWPTPNTPATTGGAAREVTLALLPQGGAALGWVQANLGNQAIYESWQTRA